MWPSRFGTLKHAHVIVAQSVRAKAATICHQSFEALPHGDRFVAAVILPCLSLLAIVLNTLAWAPRSSAFVWSESEPWDATPLELPEISMDIAICVTSECMPPSNVVALIRCMQFPENALFCSKLVSYVEIVRFQQEIT